MSTTSARADAIAAVELFCELWSKFFFAYQGRRRPLKIGIHRDIPATLIDPATVSLALQFYTGTSGCLARMQPGATRIDLEGNEIGSVSDGDAAGAKEILAARRNREAEKKAARRQQKQAVKKTPRHRHHHTHLRHHRHRLDVTAYPRCERRRGSAGASYEP